MNALKLATQVDICQIDLHSQYECLAGYTDAFRSTLIVKNARKTSVDIAPLLTFATKTYMHYHLADVVIPPM